MKLSRSSNIYRCSPTAIAPERILARLLLPVFYNQFIYFNGLQKRSSVARHNIYTKDYITKNLKYAPSNALPHTCRNYPVIDEHFHKLEHQGVSFFTSRGLYQIHYRLYGSFIHSRPSILFVTGISGNVLHGARYIGMAQRLNVNLFVMEYSNHGSSTNDGKGTTLGGSEGLDVAAVVQALASPKHNIKQIIVFATSLGNIATLRSLCVLRHHQARDSIKGFIFESPMLNVDTIVYSVLTGENQSVWYALDEAGTPAFLTKPVQYLLRHGKAVSFFRELFTLISKQRGSDIMTGCDAAQGSQYIKEPVLVLHTTKDLAVNNYTIQKFLNAIRGTAHSVDYACYSHGAHSVLWNYHSEDVECRFANLLKVVRTLG